MVSWVGKTLFESWIRMLPVEEPDSAPWRRRWQWHRQIQRVHRCYKLRGAHVFSDLERRQGKQERRQARLRSSTCPSALFLPAPLQVSECILQSSTLFGAPAALATGHEVLLDGHALKPVHLGKDTRAQSTGCSRAKARLAFPRSGHFKLAACCFSHLDLGLLVRPFTPGTVGSQSPAVGRRVPRRRLHCETTAALTRSRAAAPGRVLEGHALKTAQIE